MAEQTKQISESELAQAIVTVFPRPSTELELNDISKYLRETCCVNFTPIELVGAFRILLDSKKLVISNAIVVKQDGSIILDQLRGLRFKLSERDSVHCRSHKK